MSELSSRDRELVALGAAMGSNCVPCIEYHVAQSRKAGLGDAEIRAAIELADQVRQVPARKTLQAASSLLSPSAVVEGARTDAGCACGVPVGAAGAATGTTGQPRDMMSGMMSKMLDICGGRGQSGAAQQTAQASPAAAASTSPGCGCG